MDKITKLPWRLTNHNQVNSDGLWEINSKGRFIAECSTKEDAKYICLAVNSHEGLVEALKRSHACATVKDDGSCEGCFVSEALKKAADGKGVK